MPHLLQMSLMTSLAEWASFPPSSSSPSPSPFCIPPSDNLPLFSSMVYSMGGEKGEEGKGKTTVGGGMSVSGARKVFDLVKLILQGDSPSLASYAGFVTVVIFFCLLFIII